MKIKNLKFDFFKRFKILAPISLAIILIGVILMLIPKVGMNVGIDFAGGANVSIDFGDYVSTHQEIKDDLVEEVNNVIKAEGFEIGSVRWSGADENIYEVGIKYSLNGEKVDVKSEEAQKEFLEKIENTEDGGLKAKIAKAVNEYTTEFEFTDDQISANIVGGETSRKLLKNAILATAIAIVIMLIYIAIRFTFASGLAAIIALTHDVLVMLALTTIFQIQVNTTFIAAIITIVGYSINATIVIFDRVREVSKLDSMKGSSDAEIANKSIKDTLGRSILTTITTLATIIVLAVVCKVLGISTMSEFALPIIFGLIAGAYSSVFLSAPLWVYIRRLGAKLKKSKKKSA
ncbi:MAG: protein translocase subunit SecF [Clostridia bacterium]|nr:protein translocase subunit SecF [Clostridia bacterium]